MKKIFLSLLVIMIIISSKVSLFAKENYYYVTPGGESIGLKIETGIEIVGKYSVQTVEGKNNPWKNSELIVGDYITAVNNVKVNNNTELTTYLNNNNFEYVTLTISRNNQSFTTSIDVVETLNNEKSIGLYVKDKMLGIGTLSFVYEDKFASLGHGIYDDKKLISSTNGELTWSVVQGVKKATTQVAGEKRATLSKTEIGKIKAIKDSGVYGNFNEKLNKKKIPVAGIEEVKCSTAKIYTVINDNTVESFDVEIINLKSQTIPESKGIKIKIIDEDLINETGGIVQGMSGSPIIQDNKLIGVVSHVTVENPTIGYGIYAKWMLDEMLSL